MIGKAIGFGCRVLQKRVVINPPMILVRVYGVFLTEALF